MNPYQSGPSQGYFAMGLQPCAGSKLPGCSSNWFGTIAHSHSWLSISPQVVEIICDVPTALYLTQKLWACTNFSIQVLRLHRFGRFTKVAGHMYCNADLAHRNYSYSEMLQCSAASVLCMVCTSFDIFLCIADFADGSPFM